jgi:hypothetical protein
MAFSFTPGQIATQGSQAIAPPGAAETGGLAAPTVGPPSDSPFLIIRERGQPVSVMACVQIVLVVVAILSVVICGSMYSYSVYLTAQINTKREEIDAKDAMFPKYSYEDMLRLSIRMATLDKLLKNYISPRSPLKFLENVVENQVSFNDFVLAKDQSNAFKITFIAETSNYSSLIQQLAALNLTEYRRVITTPKTNGVTETGTLIKISIVTPVLVQGKLPDDVEFLPNKTGSSTVDLPVTSKDLPTIGNPVP